MNGTFSSIVEEVQKLSIEEKEELRQLLDKYLVEARREEIYNNYLKTRGEEKQGKLKTASSAEDFRRMLEEEWGFQYVPIMKYIDIPIK